jgi:surface carbohydrate biosynthesis protein
MPHGVLDARHESYRLSPRVLVAMAGHLSLIPALRRDGYARSWGSALHHIYLLSCIELSGAKVVITWIDNYSRTWWLSSILRGKARVISVQNGIRYFESRFLWSRDDSTNRFFLQDFLCFGEHERQLYEAQGARVERFHPVGSMRGSYFRFELKPTPSALVYDLCLPSTWTPSDGWGAFDFSEWRPFVESADETLVEFLAQYVFERDVKLAVALRSSDPREVDYFRRRFGEKAHLAQRDDSAMSTYALMDESDVVVSTSSTTAFEAMGWGKKVLFGDYIEADWGHFPVEGLWVDRSTAYSDFARHLDSIRDMELAEFAKASRDAAHFLMAYDAELPAHRYLQALVLAELAGSTE